MRVLHLIDSASPDCCATTCALIGDLRAGMSDVAARVCVVGAAGGPRATRDASPGEVDRLSAPFSVPQLAGRALRRYMRRRGGFDVIHAWSLGSAVLAALAAPRVPRLLTLTQGPRGRRSLRWLDALLGRRPTAVLAISNTIRAQLIARGLAATSVHVLRPGVDLSRVPLDRRDALRAAWGVGEGDPTILVALPGDPPTLVEAAGAAVVVGLAEETGRPLRLLLPARAAELGRALRTVRGIGKAHRVVVDHANLPPWIAWAGCDIALALDGGLRAVRRRGRATALDGAGTGGGLSLLWAMAANVPIVGEATCALAEILEDRHTALLAPPGSSQGLAERLCRLADDADAARRLRDTARGEVYRLFSRQRYVEQQRAVYEQVVAGKAAAVPAG